MSKKKTDNPYGKHSEEDVAKVESGFYYIQIGDDVFVSEEGKMAFEKERVEQLFGSIWEGLLEMKQTGTEQEKEDASTCLLFLKIYPLRLH